MRLRALFVVPALLLGGVAVPATASAASTPYIGYVDVAGSGPGDVFRLTPATGFHPGSTVSLAMSDDTTTVAVTTAPVDASGTVVLPAGARIPTSARPGSWRMTATQDDGVSARSNWFVLQTPSVSFPPQLLLGHAADLVSGTRFFPYGLATTPDVVRTVTIDGRASTVQWYADDRAFGYAGLSASVPADLTVGDHVVTFAQTGSTPYTVTDTVAVLPPTISGVPTHTGTRPILPMTITTTAPNDDYDVTVVGAAGDRHTGMRWTKTTGTDRYETMTPSVAVPGTLSLGTATLTAVSRVNGGTVHAAVGVEPATVAAPSSLAPDQWLASPDGRSLLVMETNGNLVQFHDGGTGWTSRTANHPGARLTVQSDGNLVVRGPGGQALWNAGTAGGGNGARLGFDATDTPTLTMANGRKAWSTFDPDGHRVAVGTLREGSYLFQGQVLSTTPHAEKPESVTLRLQTDGNLLLDAYASANVWSSHTAGHPGAYLVFQTDGNLVLRAANGVALWANGVHGARGAVLILQYNGDLAEFTADGRVLWHTGTRG